MMESRENIYSQQRDTIKSRIRSIVLRDKLIHFLLELSSDNTLTPLTLFVDLSPNFY